MNEIEIVVFLCDIIVDVDVDVSDGICVFWRCVRASSFARFVEVVDVVVFDVMFVIDDVIVDVIGGVCVKFIIVIVIVLYFFLGFFRVFFVRSGAFVVESSRVFDYVFNVIFVFDVCGVFDDVVLNNFIGIVIVCCVL